jgi:ribose-phosphate pyrophosphokinase
MRTFILFTSLAKHLAKNVLKRSKDFEVVFPELNRDGKRYFPDGEVYMKIVKAAKLRNKRVVVLHAGSPNPNEGLVELELILQILRDNGIKPEVFFTYFPYAMQDRVFEKGETNVAENIIEKLVNYYKAKKIYIVDAHFEGRTWVKRYPIHNLSVVPLLVTQAKRDFGDDILFISPDKGGKRRTKISGFQKKRLNSFNVEITPSNAKLNRKIVAVVDDMIKTGGTLLKCAEIAQKSGARKILALITHGVMHTGIVKVKKAYSKLYLTNTVNRREAHIDITDIIIQNLS